MKAECGFGPSVGMPGTCFLGGRRRMLEVWVAVPVLTGMSVAGTLWDEEWVDTSSDAGFFCDLEVASDGTVHAAYQDDGTQDMRHGSRSPGGVWSLATVESANDSGSYASLALESDGTPHVGYFQNFQENWSEGR